MEKGVSMTAEHFRGTHPIPFPLQKLASMGKRSYTSESGCWFHVLEPFPIQGRNGLCSLGTYEKQIGWLIQMLFLWSVGNINPRPYSCSVAVDTSNSLQIWICKTFECSSFLHAINRFGGWNVPRLRVISSLWTCWRRTDNYPPSG